MRSPVPAGKTIRAVVASRLSRVHRHATGDESQLLSGHEYAAVRGWTVVGEASDLDVSAIKVDPWKRPELSYYLNNPHEFDALIFRSIDRLARRMFDFMDLLRWADKHGIHLVCLDLGDGIDFSTPEGKMVALGLAYAAEIEGKKITERTRGARRHMRRVGRWGAGRVPDGYRLCPHPSGNGYALEPDPVRAPIVLEIVDRFLGDDGEDEGVFEGESRNAIAEAMNRRGVPSPMGAKLSDAAREKRGGDPRWSSRSITFILSNPALRGWMTHNGKVVRHTEGPDIGRPVQYGPPLITAHKWKRLQDKLTETSTSPNRPAKRNPANASFLLGVAFCGICDNRMYGNQVARKDKDDLAVYRCVARRAKGADCPGHSITGPQVEEWTVAEFLKRVGHLPTVIRQVDPGTDHTAELEEIEDTLRELREDRKAGLYKGERGTAEYRAMYVELETRRDELAAQPQRPPSARLVETGITYAQQWKVSNPADRRKLMIDAGAKVIVMPAKHRGAKDWESRLMFELTGSDTTHKQGHDETDPVEHW